MSERGTVEIWQRADGAWRWRYHPGDEHPSILSNEHAVTFEEARDAAARAYPRAEILLLSRPPARPRSTMAPGTIGRAILAGAGLAAVVAVGRGALAALRLRRRLRALRGRRSKPTE